MGFGDARTQFPRDIQRLLVTGLRQHDRKLFAAEPRYPIDAAPQRCLQARAKLPQHFVSASVAEGVVHRLEEIDVAKNQRQRASVARSSLHFARKMFPEEAPTGDPRELIGSGQLAIFYQRNSEHCLELRDAASSRNARRDLCVGSSASDAIVRAGS